MITDPTSLAWTLTLHVLVNGVLRGIMSEYYSSKMMNLLHVFLTVFNFLWKDTFRNSKKKEKEKENKKDQEQLMTGLILHFKSIFKFF